MNLIWHIAKKDLRRNRVSLAIWLVAVLLALAARCYLFVRIAPEGNDWRWTTADVGAALFGVTQYLLAMLLTADFFLADTPQGTTAFWRTRPIRRRDLLAAKGLLLAGLALFPALCEGVAFASLGLGMPAVLVGLSACVLDGLALVVGVAVLASLADTLGRALRLGFLVLLPAVVAFVLISIGAEYNRLENSGGPLRPDSVLASCLLSQKALVAFAGTALLIGRYWLRHTRLYPLVVGLATVVIGMLPSFWQWDFFLGTQAVGPANPTITLSNSTLTISGRDKGPGRAIGQVSNLVREDGLLLDPEALCRDVVVTLADGSKMRAFSAERTPVEHQEILSRAPSLTGRLFTGLTLLNTPATTARHLTVLYVHPALEKQTAAGEAFSVEGRAVAKIRQLEVEAEEPFVSNSCLRGNSWIARIESFHESDSGLRCTLVERSYLSQMLGTPEAYGMNVFQLPFSRAGHSEDDVGYVLVNRERGEVLVPKAGGGLKRRASISSFYSNRRTLTFPTDVLGAGAEQWLRGASLVRLRLRNLGRVTCPFSATDLVIQNRGQMTRRPD